MSVIEIIVYTLLAVAAILVVFSAAVFISVKRKGLFAQRVGERLMKNKRVQKSLEKKMINMVSEDPDQIGSMMSQMGASPQMQEAANQLSERLKVMSDDERNALLKAAQSGNMVEAQRIHQRSVQTTNPARGNQARAKTRAAKAARKKNRR